MGAGHPAGGVADGLHVDADSPVHRLPAEVKLVALLAVVLTVVATPRDQVWAFGLYALGAGALLALARVPARTALRRLVIEVPFVVFALLLPLVALGEQVVVLGVGLSVEGLLGGFAVLAKGTLGVLAAVVLSATTRPRDLVVGLQRLRVPGLFVTTLQFMVRYLDVVVGDLRRMATARAARGFRARHLGHAPVLARSAGALFVRSFERGERVHLAMLSRGYDGTMPALAAPAATARDWAGVAVVWLPVAVVAVLALSAGEATSVEPWLRAAAARTGGVAG